MRPIGAGLVRKNLFGEEFSGQIVYQKSGSIDPPVIMPEILNLITDNA